MPEPGPTPPPAARSCPACDARRSEWAFVVDGFPHLRCRECGTVFVSPLPSDETIRATYLDPEYHGDVDATEDRMRAEARARARVMKEHGCTRVLEIGCGAGFFVEALLELGIEAEGVDPGPQAQRAAARGLPIRPIWLEELRPTAPYDGIGMFELLEHLPDPVTALQWSRRHTRPGATLALSTPSASGLPARLLGRRFPMLAPPNHLEVFSRDGIDRLLRRGGFVPTRWVSFSNLDRDTLRRGFQRFVLGRSAPARWLAHGLASAALLPARLVDRAGLGTSFEVYAARQ
ncbi:MAG: class I SAM-dependent methyltransferase [Myxococcales bacterium]|nr:class I SAM-dependent methyltransferase [Myxococcales bacterium]MCB9719173.1 class I SAM-dependent methyltransferase [Myxococcales bacterium]